MYFINFERMVRWAGSNYMDVLAYDVTHGIATNYVLPYCVRVRRLIALTIFSAFRRYDNFSIAI